MIICLKSPSIQYTIILLEPYCGTITEPGLPVMLVLLCWEVLLRCPHFSEVTLRAFYDSSFAPT